jgi:hypothetical protein
MLVSVVKITFVHTAQYGYGAHFQKVESKIESDAWPRVFGSCSADGIMTACRQIAGRNSHHLRTTYVHAFVSFLSSMRLPETKN